MGPFLAGILGAKEAMVVGAMTELESCGRAVSILTY